jgi:hypothetical protein
MKRIYKHLSNVNFQVNNILEIYSKASPDELLSGKAWYRQANGIASAMAVKYGLNLHQCAGIIASLSPATNWNQNIVDANHLCAYLKAGKDIHSITVTTYGKNKEKAYYIYRHPELSEKEIYKIILGASKHVNKTSSFYLNILHPDNDSNVTIDRHSFRINLGITELTTIALTEKRYKLMSNAYKQASEQLEYNAIELQAITWLIFRRLYIQTREANFEVAPF